VLVHLLDHGRQRSLQDGDDGGAHEPGFDRKTLEEQTDTRRVGVFRLGPELEEGAELIAGFGRVGPFRTLSVLTSALRLRQQALVSSELEGARRHRRVVDGRQQFAGGDPFSTLTQPGVIL